MYEFINRHHVRESVSFAYDYIVIIELTLIGLLYFYRQNCTTRGLRVRLAGGEDLQNRIVDLEILPSGCLSMGVLYNL